MIHKAVLQNIEIELKNIQIHTFWLLTVYNSYRNDTLINSL